MKRRRHTAEQVVRKPTSASWMNMVADLVLALTKQQVRRGVYHDVPELIAAVKTFIAGYNQREQPFVWTKTPRIILTNATKHASHFRNAALALHG